MQYQFFAILISFFCVPLEIFIVTHNMFVSHTTKDYLKLVAESESNYFERISREHQFIVHTKKKQACNECENLKNNQQNWFPGTKCSDIFQVSSKGYLNILGNYVHGFGYDRKFIVAQVPKRSTLEVFWNMVWQEKTKIIVVLNDIDTILAHSMEKKSKLFSFRITNIHIKKYDHYVETIIDVENIILRQSRQIHIFSYPEWSIEGITDIVPFLIF